MEKKARYIYGVAAGARTVSLGPIGIEGNEVYVLPRRGISAIVHRCPAEPYQSADEETVKEWVRTHQAVLDEAKKELGTIIPMGFDTILQSKDETVSPDQAVGDWLEEDAERLESVLARIEGKDEYGVQVSYAPTVMAEHISGESHRIREIKEEMAGKSPGIAYMYKQKVEKAVKAEIERLANDWFKDFYGQVKRHCDDLVIEKSRKAGRDEVMLLNLSCLVAREKVDRLGEELGRINKMDGFSVHFSGPWPPYSFVAKPVVPAEERAR